MDKQKTLETVLLEALGLQDQLVISLKLEMGVGEIPRLTIERFVDPLCSVDGEPLRKALEQYEIRPLEK